MAERDWQQYFESTLTERLQSIQDSKPDPREELRRIRQESALRIQDSRQREERLEREYRQSLVGQLGMEPDGVLGKEINRAAGAANAADKGLRWLASAPDSVLAAAATEGLTQEHVDAFERLRNDEDAAEELSKLTARREAGDPREEVSRQLMGTPGDSLEVLDPMALNAARLAQENNGWGDYDDLRLAQLQERQAEATDADRELLNRPVDRPEAYSLQGNDAVLHSDRTALDQLRRREVSGERAEAIKDFGWESDNWFYDVNKQNLEADAYYSGKAIEERFKEAWGKTQDGEVKEGVLDMVSAVSGALVQFGGYAAENPDGIIEFVIREVGEDLATAALPGGILAPALSRAADNYNQGIENFIKEEGRMPTGAERERLGLHAAMAFGAEFGSNLIMWKGMRFQGGQSGIRDAVTAPGKVAAHGGIEGGTESVQTYAEGEASYKPADFAEVFAGGALGITAGSTAVAPSAVDDVYEGTKRTVSEGLAARRERGTRSGPSETALREAVESAVETGNLDGLLNADSPTFAPGRAVEAMSRLASAEGITPERRAELSTQATQVVSTLEAELGKLQETSAAQDLATIKGLEENIKAWETKLAELPEDADAAERAQVEEAIKVRQAALAEFEKAPEAVKKSQELARRNLQRSEQELQRATEILKSLQGQENAPLSAEEVESTVALINQPESAEQAPAAVEQVMRLAMESPDQLEVSQVESLVSNTTNGLTDEQRGFLRAFSAAKQAAHALKTLDDVTTDVFKGDKAGQYVGIEQYWDRFNLQANEGNQVRARAQLTGLENFAQQRTQKIAAIEAGLAEIEASDGARKRVDFAWDTAAGEYVRQERYFKNEKERQANGGVIVTKGGTTRLLDTIKMESEALNTAAEAMRGAYAVRFPTLASAPASAAAVSEASPVTAVSNAAQQDSNTPVVEETSAPVRQEASVESSEPVNVWAGSNENAELSNLAPRPFNDGEGREYQSVEHAYQSWKSGTFDPETYDKYQPGKRQKIAGRKGTKTDGNWNLQLMERMIEASFRQNPEAAQALLATGNRPITHTQDKGVWREAFPQALMNVRARMQQEGANEAAETATTERADATPEAAAPAADVTAAQQQANTEGQQERTTTVTEDGIEYDPETGEVVLSEPVAATEAEVIVPGEGTLTPLENAGERRTGHIADKYAFNAANLLTEYLRQDSKEHATKRPLTEVRDFLSRLKQNLALASQFVTGELTDKQQELVRHLASRLEVFNERVSDSLPAWAENSKLFRHQDYIGYFRNEETGAIDENVLTAVSYAMYAWLGENASLKHHDAKGVNALLGRDSKTPVDPAEFALLGEVGHRYNHVANDLGKRAAQALGLTSAAGVPQDVMEKVIGALGGRAVAALMKEGLFEMTVIPEAELARVTGEVPRAGVNEHTFVRVALDENSRLLADEIVETVKGTQGLLPKLFGTEDLRRPPSFKPVAFKNRKPKRSLMKIPSLQEKILAKYNQTAYYFREDIWGFWNQLSEDVQVLVAGGVDMGTFLHDANVKGAEGKNNALRRELANIQDFAVTVMAQKNGLKTPFYMDWEVWKMGRMGIRGSLVNPQASKVHRHLIKQAGWDHTVRLDNQDGSHDKFFLAVGEALGVKTDSQRNLASLKEVSEKVASAEIAKGVIAIRKVVRNEVLTDSDQRDILAAVKAGGEKMHSLDGLYALAQYEEAVDAGQSTFTHSLTREIDGKTNGPMLTQWLLGAAGSAADLLSMTIRGGFFTKASGLKHIGEWAEDKSNHDLYQMVAKTLSEVRAASLEQSPARARFYASLDFFLGQAELNGAVTKYGRNMVKTPVTALNFGSGLASVVRSMNKEFVQAIYDKIQSATNEADPVKQETLRKELIEHLNNILWEKGRGNAINPTATLAQLQKFQIQGKQLETLNSKYANTFGRDIKATLKEVFTPLIENRNALTKAASLSFTLYDMAYRYERQKYLRELVEKGEIHHDSYKAKKTDSKTSLRLYNDLTPAQEAEVRERVKALRPLANSAFSAQTGDLESGLFLSKQDQMSDGSFTYMNTSKMAPGYGVRNLVTRGSRRIQQDPGLGSVIWQVHSSDAFIAATSFTRHSALNVHDALVVGLNEDTATAQSLNQQTFEMLLSYSPPIEMAEALVRTVLAFAEYMEANPEIKTSPQVFGLLKQALATQDGDLDLSQMSEIFRDVSRVASQAETVKLEALKELGAVSQYTMEDGQYDVTEADVARIEQRLAEVSEWAPSTTSAEAMNQIIATYGEFLPKPEPVIEAAPEPVAEDSAERPSEVDEEADNRTDTTGFTEPAPLPDAEATQQDAEAMLVALDADRGMSPKALIRVAMKGATPALQLLLERLAENRFVGGVQVNIHDAENAPPGEYAWNEEGVSQVNINLPWLRQRVEGQKANPVRNSGAETIAEVIAHELTHAATVAAVYDKGNVGKRFESRLKAIQGDIRAWMAQNPKVVGKLDSTTRHQLNVMLERTSEIPTYGMTAKRIQEVLRMIPARQSKGSAWSRFVASVREALGLQNTDSSVLDEVISVTEALMQAEVNAPAGNTIRLSVDMGPSETSPMQFTSQQIFDALADPTNTLDAGELAQLQTILDGIVTRLHGPAGAFKERARETEAVGAEEVFLKSLASGQAPFVSLTRAAGFTLTDQQAFVLEQLEATLRAGMEVAGTNDLARRELGQVWREARSRLTDQDFHAGDWALATADEKRDAKARRDFLFTLSADKGTTEDHLARFAALAMVDPGLRSKLDFASAERAESQTNQNLVERIRSLFSRLLGMFHHRLVGTYAGQRADDKVWSLMDRLVDIEARRRAKLMDDSVTWQDRVEEKLEGAGAFVRGSAVKVLRSDTLRKHKSSFVRAGASITATIAADRTDALMSNMEQVRRKMFTARQGFVASLITEMRGAHDGATRMAHQLLRSVTKQNEQERVRLHDTYRQAVLESFENQGKDLTRAQKNALTRVLMDTDMAALLEGFSQEELVGILEDDSQRQASIQKLEAELVKVAGPWFDYYVGAGRDLGEHMATGNVFSRHLMLNAHNIVHLHGTRHAGTVDAAAAAAALPVLDRLVSLYALDFTSAEHRQELAPVMRQELARGQESGVAMVLQLHKRMQQESLELLFQGNPTLMQKGYRAQIYNPHKSMAIAPLTARADYEAMGYVMAGPVPNDPSDPQQEAKAIYVIMDGGMNRRLTGIVSYTGERSRGSNAPGAARNARVVAERDAYIDRLVKGGRYHDPRKTDMASHMAPKLNPKGEVVGYRYLMKQATKDWLLDRNNAVEDVFGAMAAHTFDKVSSKDQNRMAMEALKAQYDEEYSKNPDAYVTITASSTDKQFSDAYKLLPDDAKALVKELWGKNELKVRGDLVDLFFGYQKYSMADSIKRSPAENNLVEKLFALVLGKLFGEKAFLRARQAGAMWTELVKEVKDILVIKTGLTLLGNVLSNVSLMLGHGISVTDMVRDHRVAMEGIVQYRKDYSELQKLQLKLDTHTARDRAATEQRILELQRDLERNPVAFMIAEGLMPTIVEDVDLHDDPYSYKSLLAQKTEKWTSKVWKPLRTVGKNVYMTHDTVQYKVLSQGTQISDFVARYTLYQHLTTRKRDRMGHDDAIQRASDMFVNYDLPSHRMMQWLNDMGLVRFTKYYLRIQRPLMTLFQEHPARMLMLVLLHGYMPWFDVITDSGMLNRIGNPLEWGALDYPGVLDEMATVKLASTMFQ